MTSGEAHVRHPIMKCYIPFLVALGLTTSPTSAADDPPTVIFNPKLFFDNGSIVHVEGTLSGNGVGYKVNRAVLSCYQRANDCTAIYIQTQGMQVFSVYPPLFFEVKLWTADRIVAALKVPPCAGSTVNDTEIWIIDRPGKTAELTSHSCTNGNTYHWTIENPPEWQDSK